MTIISPSILSANYLELKKEIQAFDSCENLWFHLDVMDGHYVPNLTFGKTVLQGVHTVTKHKLDAHLMVTNPQDYAESFKALNLHNFTFHYETVEDPIAFCKELKKIYPSVGISINPETSETCITDDILKHVDLVLVMSVHPGFGGQKFIEGSLNKVDFFAKKKVELGLNYEIQVDGGINHEVAPLLIEKGATNLVAGSYIFKADDYIKQVNSLRS